MPNNRNAAKASRQANKRRLQNRAQLSSLKTLIKKFKLSFDSQGGAAGSKNLADMSMRLDQAGAKRLIHPNKAARLKSRLAKAANKKAAAK